MKIEKRKLLSLSKADAASDIELINQYSLKELSPDEAFVFSVMLCDNEVDRDSERFTVDCLKSLAPLFVGKTGIRDHNWSAENQCARLYRTEIVETGKTNSLGEPLVVLRGDAYMLRAGNDQLITSIEGGIIKEVSVFAAAKNRTCSICGSPMRWDVCEKGHQLRTVYDGKLCFAEYSDPVDAYEWSFVAVPAQRDAGITKSAKDIDGLYNELMASDISSLGEEKIKELIRKGQTALLSEEEKRKRAEIIAKYKN